MIIRKQWLNSITIFLLTCFCVFRHVLCQTKPTPCPDRFRYLPDATLFSWSGELLVNSDVDLIDGVFIVVIFDKAIKKLGSTFGKQVVKKSDTEYLLRNFGYELQANKLLRIRLDVDFDNWVDPPNFAGYRLNAIPWCPNPKPSFPSFNPPNNQNGDVYYQYLNNRNPFYTSSSLFPRSVSGNDSKNRLTIKDILSALEEKNNKYDQCGISNQFTMSNNGQNASPEEFPWHASIFVEDPPKIKWICDGTLISYQHILTTAACLMNVDANKLIINLGSSEIFYFSPTTQSFRGKETALHPGFRQEDKTSNNIGLILLSQRVKITGTVNFVCLWSRSDGIQRGELGVVPSYGLSDTTNQSNGLKKLSMVLMPSETCSNPKLFEKQSFCASLVNGTSSCGIDSGSGLVVKKELNPTKFVYEIRGVVTSSPAESGNCADFNTVLLTDVAKHLNWIVKMINP